MTLLFGTLLLTFALVSADIPPSDLACWASHTSYSITSRSIINAPEASKPKVTYPSKVSTWVGDYTVRSPTPETTLCDGYPRVTGRQTPTGSAPTYTTTIHTPWVSTWMPPSPTCRIPSYGTACRSLYSSYTAIISGTPSPTVPGYLFQPPCQTPDTYPSNPDRLTCSLVTSILTYQVLYWPTTSVDLCSTPSTTPTPTSTIPQPANTAVYKNITMTSPTLYYIIDNLQMKTFAGLVDSNRGSAWADLPNPSPTPTFPITGSQDPIQTPASSALISCNLGRVCSTTLRPFRFDHLATVPMENYYSMFLSRDVIYQGLYVPYYTLVPEMSPTGRGWEVCASMVTGWIRPTYIPITTASP